MRHPAHPNHADWKKSPQGLARDHHCLAGPWSQDHYRLAGPWSQDHQCLAGPWSQDHHCLAGLWTLARGTPATATGMIGDLLMWKAVSGDSGKFCIIDTRQMSHTL